MTDRWMTIGATVVRITFADDGYAQLLESIDRSIGRYSLQVHQQHTTPGQRHIHVLLKAKRLFALNQDGSAHDNSHGIRLPNEVRDGLRKDFPDWVIPNVLEGVDEIAVFVESLGWAAKRS